MRAGETHGTIGGFGFDDVGEATERVAMEGGAQRVMHGAELEFGEGVVEAPDAGAVEVGAERVPGVVDGGDHLAPVLQHMVLVGVEVEAEAAFANLAGAAEVVQVGGVVVIREDGVVSAGERERFVKLGAVEGAGVFVGAERGTVEGA